MQSGRPKGAIRVGMLGLGTVGSRVADVLIEKRQTLARRIGRDMVLVKALVRDPSKKRSTLAPKALLTTDPADVVANPEVDVVVEVLGGVEPAFTYMRTALDNGKHLVTANKEVMAHHGPELLQLASERGRDLFFEASVGGGIPLIGPFRQDLAANEITEIHAIINGTTNYILTRMAQDGIDFGAALQEAQAKGYAEPDPANDIEGHDAAYKLAILASLAFSTPVPPDRVFREGIRNLAPVDFAYAAELGYAVKLLAISKKASNTVEVRVHPALVTRGFLLSQVSGVENAVRVKGDLVGHAIFAGRGAGPGPTASAIVADLIDLAYNIESGVHSRLPSRFDAGLTIRPIGDVISRYYFRLWVADKAGVLAQIGLICANTGISIAAIVQKEADPKARTAEIVILTHAAKESSMQQALTAIAELEVVDRVAAFLRVEDLVDD